MRGFFNHGSNGGFFLTTKYTKVSQGAQNILTTEGTAVSTKCTEVVREVTVKEDQRRATLTLQSGFLAGRSNISPIQVQYKSNKTLELYWFYSVLMLDFARRNYEAS